MIGLIKKKICVPDSSSFHVECDIFILQNNWKDSLYNGNTINQSKYQWFYLIIK